MRAFKRALRWIKARQEGSEGGFSLAELLVTISVSSIIVVAIASAFIVSMKTTSQASTRLDESNDAQILSSYFAADAAGATYFSASVLPPGACAISGLSPRALFSSTDPAAGITRYALYGMSTTSPTKLVRRYCAGTQRQDSTVASSVATADASCGGADCPPAPAVPQLVPARIELTVTSTKGYGYTVQGSPRATTATSVVNALPTVASVLRDTAVSERATKAGFVQWRVRFSERVTGVGPADFSPQGSVPNKPATVVVGGVSGGSTYTVRAATGTGTGTLSLTVLDDNTILDLSGNKLGGPVAGDGLFTTGQIFAIDRTAPTGVLSYPGTSTYRATNWAGAISGTVSDPVVDAASTNPDAAGSGVNQVDVTIRRRIGTSGSTYHYWSAADNAFTSVQKSVSVATIGPNWSVPFPITNFPGDGQYGVQIAAVDKLGNAQSPTSYRNFDIVAPPQVTLTAPVNGSQTLDVTPEFSGTRGTASGDLSTVTVRIYVGAQSVAAGVPASGTPVQTFPVTGSGGSWTGSLPTPQALSPGLYTAQASQADNTGEIGYTSTRTFTVYVDTTPPDAPSVPDLVVGSDTGSSNSDNVTKDATPTFSGTAEDGATVRILAGPNLIGTVTASGGVYTLTPATALADGTHIITATATDPSGNTSVASGGLTVTVDTAAPALVLSTISNGGNGTETFSGTSTDKTGTITLTVERESCFWIFCSWEEVRTYTVSSFSGTISPYGWSHTDAPADLSNGTDYRARAVQTDLAGNVSNTTPNRSFTGF